MEKITCSACGATLTLNTIEPYLVCEYCGSAAENKYYDEEAAAEAKAIQAQKEAEEAARLEQEALEAAAKAEEPTLLEQIVDAGQNALENLTGGLGSGISLFGKKDDDDDVTYTTAPVYYTAPVQYVAAPQPARPAQPVKPVVKPAQKPQGRPLFTQQTNGHQRPDKPSGGPGNGGRPGNGRQDGRPGGHGSGRGQGGHGSGDPGRR